MVGMVEAQAASRDRTTKSAIFAASSWFAVLTMTTTTCADPLAIVRQDT